MLHLWDDGVDGWESETVQVPSNGAFITVPSYMTLISLTNQNGTPMSNSPVSVYTEEPLTVRIKGVEYYLDGETPLATTTDGNGQIMLMSPADDINTPDLMVDVGTTEPGASVQIDPNANAIAKLKAMTAQDYALAKGPSGPLLSPAWQTKSTDVYNTMQSLLDYQIQDSAASHPALNRGKQNRGVRLVPRGSKKFSGIDIKKVLSPLF